MAYRNLSHVDHPFGNEYEPEQDTWVREHAALVVCGLSQDAEDAKGLLATLGLMNVTRASTIDHVVDPTVT